MKKRIISVLLSGIMVMGLLAGCGSSSGSVASAKESSAGAKAEDGTVIEFWTIDLKAAFGDFFDEMIAKYEEENPGVKVNWTDVPFDDIKSKLVTAVAGGTAPDVVNLNTEMTLTLAGQGALVDLNAEATDEQKNIYTESLWKSASIGDSVYAFPWYASPDIMFYNKELFEKAGMETPKTFDEALSKCEEFHDKTGAYIFTPDTFFNILVSENISIINEDGTKATFNNDETLALLDKYKSYTDKGALSKTKWGDWDEELKQFESGTLAIVSSSGSSLSRVKDEAPDIYEKIAITTPLTGANGLSRNPLMNLVVPTASSNHEVAIAFANYVTNDANQLAFCKTVSIFPSTKEASKDEYFTSDESTLEGQASAMSAKASLTSEDFSLGVGNQSNIEDAINRVYEAVIINGEDAKTALDQAEEDVNALLDENNSK